ncbi:MAG: SDR family oxidoreductase [Gemmatimonadetes bacterium]|nr:SDR family oxidoreductase [Gemmatimonadota bacterium]
MTPADSAPTFVPGLLSGKTAFVAGGTSGINLAIAHGLAEAGASVAVFSRNAERVEQAATALRAHGGRVEGYVGDVREFAAIERALGAAREALGALDIVVSGAAGNFICPANQLSPNGFKAVVDIDLLGTFNVLRAAYAHLARPGASLINIGAPQSTEAFFGQAHVSAAKAGVDMLTRSLAVEWGREGIRVNGIVPGPIEGTEGVARLAPTAEIRAAWEQGNPMGRMGTGREVANVALFLSSPAASYVNGTIIYCDGGQVLGGARDYRAAWEAQQATGSR